MPKICSGTFQDALGNPLVGAKVYFRLSQDTIASGTAVVAPSLVSGTTNASGVVSVSMYFNDELTPANTTYSVSVVQAGGGLVWGAENISITGSSFNLNTAVPTTLNVLLGIPVLQNPTALQTITGFDLALSGANLRLDSTHVVKWNLDTGLSRDSAGVLAVGNGAQGDTTGSIKLTRATALGTGGQANSSFIARANGSPGIGFNSTGGAADQKWADCFLNATTFAYRFVNDANSAANAFMTVSRGAGAAVGAITFGAGGGVQTLFTSTDTVVGKATTDVLTNKTLTSPSIGTPTVTGTIQSYNSFPLVGNGIPVISAAVDLTGQTANIGSTLLQATGPSGAGLYRVTVYIVVTTVGATSTLPAINIIFTDKDNSTSQTVPFTVANSGNTLNTIAVNSLPISVKASTNINYSTTGYASTGTPMQYAVHIKLEPLL